MSTAAFSFPVGGHEFIIQVPAEQTFTGAEIMALAALLRSFAGAMERMVAAAGAMPERPRCGCPSCTARRARAN